MADKALLVGINKYADAPLAGCVNDVTDMADFLVKSCGFNSANIRLLVDKRATTEAIKARLEWLVSDLKAGDRIYFHFSGHGAQAPTRNPKGEVDGLDEVICPVDFDWEDKRMIRDDDFIRIFLKIPAGVTAVWVSDSCHSGDLSRDASWLGGRKPRFMPQPEDIQWRMRAVVENKIPVKVKVTVPNIALISGCRSDQTSADASFKSRSNGALTYHLLQELRSNPDASLEVLVNKVRAALKKAKFTQVPQLEGPAEQLSKGFLKP